MVRGNRGRGGDGGVTREREGEEDAVKARGPSVGGRGVGGDVVKGVGILRGLEDRKFIFEGGPGGGEGGRGEEGGRGCGVSVGVEEIEVPTEKGGEGVVSRRHSFEEAGVKFELAAGFEVSVEELEWGVVGGGGEVTPQLDKALGDGREWNVDGSVVLKDAGGVDDQRATRVGRKTIARDDGLGEGGEGEAFILGKVGFLNADDVVGFREV